MAKAKTVKVKKLFKDTLIVSGHALMKTRYSKMNEATRLTEGILVFVTFYSNLKASKSFIYVRTVDGIMQLHIHSIIYLM